MSQNTRDIKRRIKSVGNTNKITKAMELVSAAKMRKAVARVLATRSYSDLTWETILHLVKKVDISANVFFDNRPDNKNIAVILISTNRGLCGSFNAQVTQKFTEVIKTSYPQAKNIDLMTLGKKGQTEIRRRDLNLIADFAKEDISESSTVIRPLTHMIIKDWQDKKYDKVLLAFTDFESSLKQTPHVKQLLPIVPEIDAQLAHIIHEKKEDTDKIKIDNISQFIFEPSQEVVLDYFVPRLLEIQIYQAVLESEASEHSARMLAMRNASEAAQDMMQELTLVYNQARQAGITAELAEISSGALALE